MLKIFKRKFYQYPVRIGAIIFCVLLVITQYLSFQKYLLNISTEKQTTIQELNRVTDQLQGTLTNALSVTKTLSFLVENYGFPEDFSLIGSRLMENNSSLDAVQLVQNGVITDIYPLEGNEIVIGYNVLEDETRNKELIRAYEQNELFFAGPFELRQGGLGIVGRYPIEGEQPYSFAAVVINLSTLLENSGIVNKDPAENFKFQLSKINPNTNKEEFFLEEFDQEFSDQIVIINIPQGEWILYAAVKNSARWDGVFQLIILGLLLSFLGGYIFWYITKQPARLQSKVREKTKLISANEKRYRALVENSLDAVAILNPQGNTTYVSPSITKVLGYSEEEIMVLNLFDILHEEDIPFVIEEMQYLIANPGISIKGHISRIKHKDGTWRWIEAAITNLLEDPDVRGIVDNFRDITLKKDAEDRIKKEKELSEAIINSLPGIFYLFNKEGKFLVWNENFEKVSGYTAAEIKGMNPTEFFAPEDREYITSRIQKVFEEEESFAETYFYTKDRKKIFYYFTGKSIIYEGETCLLGTGIDLSQRKIAEEALKKSEEQMISIFNNAIDAVIMMDTDGIITNWNPKAEKIFGWTSEEAIGNSLSEMIIPEQHRKAHAIGMENYRRYGTTKMVNRSVEITAINKQNNEFAVSLGISSGSLQGKIFFIGFISDISERKKAEMQKEYEKRNKEALINATKDMIWSVSKEITLISANQEFKKSFEIYSGHEIKEGEFLLADEFFDGDYLNMWKTYYKRGLKGQAFTIETTVQPNEKQTNKTVETSFSPIIVDNKVVGVACFARDISQRIKIEEEIKEYNNKLRTAQEIAQLGYWEHIYGDEVLYWTDQIYKIWEIDQEKFTPTIESFFKAVVPEDRNKFNLYANRPIDNFQEQDIEYRIITATGKLKWIHQYGQKVIDKKNNLTTFKGTIRDITHQKMQEESILEFNEKLQTAQKIAKLGYWEFDFKNEELTWSDQVFEIFEKTEKTFKVTPEAFYNTIHPDDFEEYYLEQNKALSGEKTLEKEHRIILNNGKVKWVLERGELVYNEAGKPLVFEGTVQDITKQKLIEMELREQYQFITTAIDNLPVGIAVRNIETGKFTLMNKNFTQIYGWSKRELRDVNTFFDKVYPDADYRKKIKDQIFRDLTSKDVNRMQWDGIQVTTKKGEKRIVNSKNIPLYDQNLMISSVVDVTEKALAEDELLKINERYEYVSKATFDAIWDWDIEKDTMYLGEGFQTIFGVESTSINMNVWRDRIHPDDLEHVNKSIQTAFESFERNWMYEYRFKTGSGGYAYVKDKGVILRNIDRKVIRMIGAMQDISKLHQIQELYHDLFHLSPFPVYVYAIDTLEFVDVNKAAVEHYGYSKEEFNQMTLRNIRPKEDIPILEKAINKMTSEQLKRTYGTYRHQKKNGDIIHVYIQGNLIQYMDRDCEIIVAYDVTEQKKQENEILEMNKKLRNLSAHLQTAREEERIYIAREIHDEFGQQLTGIKLDVSWLKNKTEEVYPEGKERTKRLIDNINLTINKVRKIATDLRPGVLDDLGLEAALEWHSQNFHEQTGIVCTLKTRNTRSNYDKAINTSLYRIFQEALTNILRHAEATEIQILLFEEMEILVLIVEDNGKGITDIEKNNNQSLGITGMRERATMLNGEFNLSNRKEGGAVLKVCIPLVNM